MSTIAVGGFAYFIGGIGFHRVSMLLRNRRACSLLTSTAALSLSTSSAAQERKKSSVYTRTGDKGQSSLYNGQRRSKTDDIFQALGHQDELNAVLGIAIHHCIESKNGLEPMLFEIQSRIFDLGAAVATPTGSSGEKLAYTEFPRENTLQIEEWIDSLDAQVPPITQFVLPSGGMSSLQLNLARAVCRRAERSVVGLVDSDIVDQEVGRYLNRLSDLLFVCTRVANSRENKGEILWKKFTPMPRPSD